MGAIAQVDRGEVFWFWHPSSNQFHAYNLILGGLEPYALCGRIHLESCDDEPELEYQARFGQQCHFCLAGAAAR